MQHWEGRSLERLLMHIRENMPADGVDSVSDAHKLDAMTYILRMNGFPSGGDELKADPDVLAQLQVARKRGPGPLATGATVSVLGCLAQEASGAWVLTNGTEPAATTIEPPTPAELKATAATPLGSGTVRLRDLVPGPDTSKGQRVEAKGLLI